MQMLTMWAISRELLNRLIPAKQAQSIIPLAAFYTLKSHIPPLGLGQNAPSPAPAHHHSPACFSPCTNTQGLMIAQCRIAVMARETAGPLESPRAQHFAEFSL